MTRKGCFISGDKLVKMVYLYFPISLVLLLNLVLYSVTAWKIFKVQKEFKDIQKNGLNSKHSRMNHDKNR
jgi:hypothetical protein